MQYFKSCKILVSKCWLEYMYCKTTKFKTPNNCFITQQPITMLLTNLKRYILILQKCV